MIKKKLSFRFIFNSVIILLFAVFLTVCAFATLKTYENYRDSRKTVQIAYPKEGVVRFSIDRMAFIKSREDVKFDYDTRYIALINFTKGCISRDNLDVGDTVDVIISDSETAMGTVVYIEQKEPISMNDTEYKYYIGFNSDSFDPEEKTVRMQFAGDEKEYENTLPARAVHSDSGSDYVFIVVPQSGVLGTEYVTRKVRVNVWPREESDTVSLTELPDELLVYPVVIRVVGGSLRSKNSDGVGVSVNLEQY